MIRFLTALTFCICTALPASAQDRVMKWNSLDPLTIERLLTKLEAAGFTLDGMRPLSLTYSQQACKAGCTLRNAGCSCPKQGASCDEGTEPSPGGALCTGPLGGVNVMLEDGRISPAVDLP